MAGQRPGKTRWRMTREGLMYAVITSCILVSSFIQEVNLLVLVFALMTMPVALGLWLTRRNLRDLEIGRRLPGEVFVGRAFDVEIEVANHRRVFSALGICAEDRLDPPMPQFRPMVFFPEIPAKGRRKQVYRAVMRRRGLYRFGSLDLLTRFPFGFFERRLSIPLSPPDELVVFPQLGQLTREWKSVAGLIPENSHSRHKSPAGSQDEYHGLREYRESDNPRHIHWRTSARLGELMVKEFEPEESLDTLLILEPWLSERASESELNAVELLVSFAATICVDLCHRPSQRLVLIIAGEPAVVRQGHTSRRLLEDYLRLLAITEGSAKADLTASLNDMAPTYQSGMRVLLISTRTDAGHDRVLSERFGLRAGHRGVQMINVSAGDLQRYFTIEPVDVAG